VWLSATRTASSASVASSRSQNRISSGHIEAAQQLIAARHGQIEHRTHRIRGRQTQNEEKFAGFDLKIDRFGAHTFASRRKIAVSAAKGTDPSLKRTYSSFTRPGFQMKRLYRVGKS